MNTSTPYVMGTYELQNAIDFFFLSPNIGATKDQCDEYVRNHQREGHLPLVPIVLQGTSSYTVAKGSAIFQFRIHKFNSDIRDIARAIEIYPGFVPSLVYWGTIGCHDPPKQPLHVYEMSYISGIPFNYQPRVLRHGVPDQLTQMRLRKSLESLALYAHATLSSPVRTKN